MEGLYLLVLPDELLVALDEFQEHGFAVFGS